MSKNINMEYSLDTSNLKDIPFDKYEKDFTFIVNGQEYKTSRYFADVISPTVRNLHMTDESANSFEISTDDPTIDINDIFKLMSFDQKEIDISQQESLKDIFLLLGNKKEYFRVDDDYQDSNKKEKIVRNLLRKIKRFKKLGKKNHASKIYSDEIFQREIEYISGHFFEIDKENLMKLPIDFIEAILRNEEALKLEDEDSLVEFINKLVEKNEKYSYLYEYVQFNQVSNDTLKKFYDHFSLDYINVRIFESLINRSMKAKIHKDNDDENYEEEEEENNIIKRYVKNEQSDDQKFFEFNQKFKGIINYLNSKVKGNLHDKGIVEVASNSFYDNPKNLLDFTEDNCYQSGGKNDIYITYDFKNRKIKITDYSIKAHKSGTHQLKSWIIEVSNDKVNWTKIDEHNNDPSLRSNNNMKSFKVTPVDQFFRYVRLTQTDEPWEGKNVWFHYIEFFGYLKGPVKDKKMTTS